MSKFPDWEEFSDIEGELADNYRKLKTEIERLRAEVSALYATPPCRECGAMTSKDSETLCRCVGDRDHCHGCELWDGADQ